jgi:hypothetical protein
LVFFVKLATQEGNLLAGFAFPASQLATQELVLAPQLVDHQLITKTALVIAA